MYLLSLGSNLNTLLSFTTLALYIAGIVICGIRIKNDSLYKYGLWFFILHLSIDLFGLLKSFVIIPLIVRKFNTSADYASTVMLLNIPNHILAIISYILLIIGFSRGYKNKISNSY